MSFLEVDILSVGTIPEPSQLLSSVKTLHVGDHFLTADLDVASALIRKAALLTLVDGPSLVKSLSDWQEQLEGQIEQSLKLDGQWANKVQTLSELFRDIAEPLLQLRTMVDSVEGRLRNTADLHPMAVEIKAIVGKLDELVAHLKRVALFEQ